MGSSSLSVEIASTAELGAAEIDLWAAFQQAQRAYRSPFHSPDYHRLAGEIAPGAAVALLHQAGTLRGFFTFQRRGRLIQPLAAPLTDYHGPVMQPGFAVDMADLVRRLGAGRYSFTAAPRGQGRADAPARPRLAADLGAGFEAYLAQRNRLHRKFIADKERVARGLAKDVGEPEYRLEDPEPGLLAELIARKREQYQLTGQYDVFACGWTGELLRTLLGQAGAVRGRIATLRVGEALIAAEYSLYGGDVCHFWFPVYAPAFARYSPGALLSLNSMRQMAETGVTEADFGLDDAPYKHYFTEPAELFCSGTVTAGRPPRWTSAAARKIAARWNLILACEASEPRALLAAAGMAGMRLRALAGR